MNSLLDELEKRTIDRHMLVDDIKDATPADFNYAWVVPVIVTDLNRDYYNLQIERMRYIIDALSDDGRSLVVDNWMTAEKGFINHSIVKRISEHSAGFNEIFIMFNFTPWMRPKRWLNLLFWTSAQLATICCEIETATCLLASIGADNKWHRVATLVYNPNICHLSIISENKYLPTYMYAREALLECIKDYGTLQDVMHRFDRIRRRYVYDKRPIAVTAAADTLNYPNNLADATDYRR